MAFTESLENTTFEADADLSTKQYRFVKDIDGSGTTDVRVNVCDTAGEQALGVLQNKPKGQGHAATVGRSGTSKFVAGEALARGDDVTTDAQGRAIKADPGAATPATAASATLNPTGNNNAVVYTARDAGDDGNGISVEYADPADIDKTLSVDANGNDIVVHLATSHTGDITSTADDIKAAIAADGDANALVSSADAAGNDGSGVVTAVAPTSLSGGADAGELAGAAVLGTARLAAAGAGSITSVELHLQGRPNAA